MDARWIPVLAAAVGVLGGVGGALVGGFWANEGQEAGFKRERAAARQDLLRETYGDYVGFAQEVVATFEAGLPQGKVEVIFVKLRVAEKRVALVTENPDIKAAAAKVRETLTADTTDKRLTQKQQQQVYKQQVAAYEESVRNFLAVARAEIEATAK